MSVILCAQACFQDIGFSARFETWCGDDQHWPGLSMTVQCKKQNKTAPIKMMEGKIQQHHKQSGYQSQIAVFSTVQYVLVCLIWLLWPSASESCKQPLLQLLSVCYSVSSQTSSPTYHHVKTYCRCHLCHKQVERGGDYWKKQEEMGNLWHAALKRSMLYLSLFRSKCLHLSLMTYSATKANWRLTLGSAFFVVYSIEHLLQR